MLKTNNASYEKYLSEGLESLSKNFIIKSYKLANQEEWMGFERGKDIRIQIHWKSQCIWEWIMEKAFWLHSNTNKEDRAWMRKHADVKIEACKNALVRKKTKTVKAPKEKIKICSTQDAFEKMKSK